MGTRRSITVFLVGIDALALGLAMTVSYYLRIGGSLVPYHGPHELRSYVLTALFILPAWLAIHAVAQLYSFDLLFEGLEEYALVIKTSTFGVLALIVASFWERWVLPSRAWVVITWLLSMIFVVGGRALFRRVIYRARARGRLINVALIVGANEHATMLARQFRGTPHSGTKVVGFLDDYLPEGTPVMDDLKILGPPLDIEYIAASAGATELIIVPEALAWESFQEIVRRVASAPAGIRVRLSPGVYEILTTGVNVHHRAYIPLLTLQDIRITGYDAVLKSTLDYALGSLLLLLNLPLMALIALALKLSGGPVLDRRVVLGLKGRPFTSYKFHTGVRPDSRRTLARASLEQNHVFSGTVARMVYRCGLDKSPQLWNVLRGEMSLVGGRAVNGSSDNPWLPNLLTVKPGMTGPWALTHNTSVDYEIRATLYYIRCWNILLDIQILAQTCLSAILAGRLDSAYVPAAVSADLRPSLAAVRTAHRARDAAFGGAGK